jgi:replication fork protection complex subunit Csm3/Swi3
MSAEGIPALMKKAKMFKVKGKGHEVSISRSRLINTILRHYQASDLRRLMSMYQLWAHGMFPKGDFESTVLKVENVCRKRRMDVSIHLLNADYENV